MLARGWILGICRLQGVLAVLPVFGRAMNDRPKLIAVLCLTQCRASRMVRVRRGNERAVFCIVRVGLTLCEPETAAAAALQVHSQLKLVPEKLHTASPTL